MTATPDIRDDNLEGRNIYEIFNHQIAYEIRDDKISKKFYYLGWVNATDRAKEFVMPNTDKTAVEIEWVLDTPVREDIYEYIVNG